MLSSLSFLVQVMSSHLTFIVRHYFYSADVDVQSYLLYILFHMVLVSYISKYLNFKTYRVYRALKCTFPQQYLCSECHAVPLFIETSIHWTIGLLVVAAGPNKVLTFAGRPVVYEHEWNQIPSARREQPYMSAIAGIIHDSSHLALLFLG